MFGMNNEDKTIDFYEEDGTIIMTEAYHIRRGYCCQNGCRHCPYGFMEKSDEQNNLTPTEE